MQKITVVGDGFSAATAKLTIDPKNVEFIAVNNTSFLREFFGRKRSLEVNKMFPEKAESFGDTIYNLENLKLHDRLSSGGNSNVWGGMVDTSDLSVEARKICKKII